MSGCTIRCHICAAESLELVPGYDDLCRVTSDCKPWQRGGRLAVCSRCGSVQKPINDAWRSEAGKIYGDYSIYYQSEGVEQAVFDATGQSAVRSRRLLEALGAHVKMPEVGRLLDLGCGNGAMLRAFSDFAPRWSLAGSELSDRTRAAVERIKGVEALYVGEPDRIPGNFDMITMSHLLEHIANPVEYLSSLHRKLKPKGLLVIQVPNYQQNPFDLLVADHASHFSPRTAADLIGRSGYEVIAVATDWVPKELTIVAASSGKAAEEIPSDHEPELEATVKTVDWLKQTVISAQECARSGIFGLFGTSIAATWLFAELGESVSFFVDEDPSRIGNNFMGRPVFHPQEAPPNSHVFIGLPATLAESVYRRIARDGVRFVLPPPWNEVADLPDTNLL